MNEDKKAQQERRFLLLFETAKRSLLAADSLVKQVLADLKSFEPDIEARIDIGDRAVPTLINAIAFVDFAFRFGQVVANLPFIRRDHPAMKKLATELKPAEKSRHHLQHLRNELSQDETIDYPLLGALSWVNGITTYTVSFSQPGPSSIPSVVFDTKKMEWVSTHTFVVKHVYVDLDRTLAEMHSAFDWIRSGLVSSDPNFTDLKWGPTYAMAIKFVVRSRACDITRERGVDASSSQHGYNPKVKLMKVYGLDLPPLSIPLAVQAAETKIRITTQRGESHGTTRPSETV